MDPNMAGRHSHRTPASAAPEDRSWAARAEGLKREKPAPIAFAFALLASLAMLAGWVAVLIAPGGNVRGNPLFWLLAAPVMVWLWGAQSYAVWAVKAMWLVLVLAPCLALLALFVAPRIRQAGVLEGGSNYLDTPVAMWVILGLTTALAGVGLVALRRSSLPGGTGSAAYIPPGTPMPGGRMLTPAAANTLTKGSLSVSGTLINGLFFTIVATMEPVGPGGAIWPAALVAALVLVVSTLVFRGGFRLARRRPGAIADLRRGWRSGIGCAIAALAGLWAWPTLPAAKLGFSCFMVPVAIAAAWGGRSALRDLPAVAGSRETGTH